MSDLETNAQGTPPAPDYTPEQELEKHKGIWMRIKDVVKGFVIGASMLVPGVSGGTIAILLGIYDDIIGAVSSVRKHFKKSVLFLFTVAIGGGIGVILLSKPMEWLAGNFASQMMFLFTGAVIGSVPMICRQAKVKKFSPGVIGYPIIGAAVVIAIGFIPEALITYTPGGSALNYLLVFVIGLVVSAGFVLPGISLSFLLLVFGLYDDMLTALKPESFDLGFLIPLGLGLLVGAVIIAKILDKLLRDHTQGTFLVILGFVLGSIYGMVTKAPPVGYINMIYCVITFFVGFGVIYLVSRKEK